jgi:CubicO group peptidase (beta-lactamase class C family)
MKNIVGIIICSIFLILSCTSNVKKGSDFEASTPAQTGFDQPLFDKVIDKAKSGDYGTLTSLIVISDDKLIAEKYFNGWQRDSVHTVQSVSKSITSLLVGKAIELGNIQSVDERILDLLPELRSDTMELVKDSLTLKDYLTMSAGFEWSERYPPMDKRSSLYPIYTRKQDYINYFFSQPMIHAPGEVFEYNSGLSMTLGAVLQRKTSTEVETFAEKHLFKPMDIKYVWHNSVIWEKDKDGLAHCGGGLYMRPLDMAKIGSMVLHDGMWNGKQIISKQWIAESTSPKIDAGNFKKYRNYGYQWWLYNPLFELPTILYADGLGGQSIFILKEFNTVIVTTGDLSKNGAASVALLYDLMATHKQCKKQIMKFYEKVNTGNYSVDKFKSEEIVSLAQNLVLYDENEKAIRFLSKYASEHENNWYYEYYLGKAYFQHGDFENARIHLEKSLVNNSGDVWYLKPYFNSTKEMIHTILKRSEFQKND